MARLISAGLLEVTTTHLIPDCRIPIRVAIAASVGVLAIAATVGAAVHALAVAPPWYVGWSIPGVLIGGTTGRHMGIFVPTESMERAFGIRFGILGMVGRDSVVVV